MEMYNEIARSIKGHTKKIVNKELMSSGIEIGVVNNYGLKLDNFKYEIKDFSILEIAKPITAGDRVLVAACGSEYIVFGRIVNA